VRSRRDPVLRSPLPPPLAESIELDEAERVFLRTSVAVWREIDRLTAEHDGVYPGLPAGDELRRREREAWERYRDLLDRRPAGAKEMFPRP